MVSIISRWLQKRMPSFEKIESKLTKEEVENNKDITNNLYLNIFLLIFFLLFLYLNHVLKLFSGIVIFFIWVSTVINAISIVLSIVFSNLFQILKYKFYMFMVIVSAICSLFSLFVMVINDMNSVVMKASLLVISVFFIYIFFSKHIFNSKDYDLVLKYSIVLLSVISIIGILLGGKGIGIYFIKSIFGVAFMIIIMKVVLNILYPHYETLFYLLTYPEEFRKKFGYSVKEWYGIHSPQYKAEKDQ